MGRVMTDGEIASAAQLDRYAIERAAKVAEAAAEFSTVTVDAVRVLVCELAFRLYLPFSTKFRAGNSHALRDLLDACWSSIEANVAFPTPGWVKAQLNSADFDSEYWDQSTASDAVAGLCIFDACFDDSASAQGGVEALRRGLEQIFLWEIQKMIDRCAETDRALEDLAKAIESGVELISCEQSIVTGLEIAKREEYCSKQFADFVRQSLSHNFPGE